MILPHRLILTTVSALSVAVLAMAAEPAFDVSLKDGSLAFRTADAAFQGGRPEVLILTGEAKQELLLEPQGKAEESVVARTTPMGPAKASTRRWNDPRGYTLSWTLSRLEQAPGFTLQMTFENHSQNAVRLREFHLCASPESRLKTEGKPGGWCLSTLDSHDSSVGGYNPSGDLATKADRKFLDTLTLYTENGSKGMLMGAVGPAVSDVRFRCGVTETGMSLVIASEMNDVIVDPGEARCSEEVLVLAEPFDTATPALLRWLAATHGSRTARGPLAGWCSWYHKGQNITAKDIGDICTAVQANRDRMPVQLIQIDDGWQKAYGDWEINRTKFPDGMKAVADQIRATGAIPGIWLCPNRTSKAGAHPDGSDNEWQDCSHPAVQAFIRKMLTDRVAEGYRYFKLDFLWIRNLSTRHNQKKTRLEICRDVNKLYRECIGEESYLLSCVGGFNRGCFGYADGARIGTDTTRSMGKLYVGCSLANCINATGSTAWANGILFANDPDVAYLSFGKNELLRTWYSHVGLLGGLMLTSDPLASLDPAAIRNYEAFTPPAPDLGRPFDGQTDPWHRRFGFIAKRPWGNFASVLLWNPEDNPADIDLKGIPMEARGKKFHVWSYWDEKYLGIADESFQIKQLPKHNCAVLRLTPAVDDLPVLVGSTLHIAMGSAEIKDVKHEGGTMTIALTDAGARDGKLFLYSRAPLTLKNAAGVSATLTVAGDNLWCLALADRRRNTPNVIQLAIGKTPAG